MRFFRIFAGSNDSSRNETCHYTILYYNKMATEKTKTRIGETAIEMFNTHGFKGVTMDSISSELHISKRTVYEVFSSKNELVLECLTQVHQQIGRTRMELIGQTEEPLLMTLYIMRNAIKQQVMYHRLLEEAEVFYEKMNSQLLSSFSKKFKNTLCTVFENAMENGDLRENVDLDTALDIIVANIRRFYHSNWPSYDGHPERIREACFTYLRGLLSIKAIERYDKNEKKMHETLELWEKITESQN